MIGKMYVSTFPFYDMRNHRMSFKNRPVLIIGKADETDYVVLPVSRVTNRGNLDEYYDVEIMPRDYPLTNFKQTSYIRCHKQTVINKGSLTKEIVNFKYEYSEKYIEVISKVEEFQNGIINNAF